MSAAVAIADAAELSLSLGQLKPQSKNLHGAIFGDLVAEVIVGTDDRGHLWRLRCNGCGAKVYRHAVSVRRMLTRWRDKLACRTCMAEERRTQGAERAKAAYLELWERTGSLYGRKWEQRVRAEILEDLEEQIAPMRQDVPDDLSGVALREVVGSGPTQIEKQQSAYMYRIGPKIGCVWRCINCGNDFARGLGCVLCIEPVCDQCARAEAHRCTLDREEWTLAEIGAAVGVSRERARQIQDRAIRLVHKALCDAEAEEETRCRARKFRRWLENPGHCVACGQRIASGATCSMHCAKESAARAWRDRFRALYPAPVTKEQRPKQTMTPRAYAKLVADVVALRRQVHA